MPSVGGFGSTSSMPTNSDRDRMVAMSAAHHEIHKGKSYQVSASATVASSAVFEVVITTPASPQIHLVADAAAGGEFTFEILEAIDAYSGGTSAIAYNRNRQSSNTTSVTSIVYGTPTYTGGTTIHGRRMGLGKDGGSDANYDREWILKASTRYAFKITSHASSNPCSILLSFYEHT